MIHFIESCLFTPLCSRNRKLISLVEPGQPKIEPRERLLGNAIGDERCYLDIYFIRFYASSSQASRSFLVWAVFNASCAWNVAVIVFEWLLLSFTSFLQERPRSGDMGVNRGGRQSNRGSIC